VINYRNLEGLGRLQYIYNNNNNLETAMTNQKSDSVTWRTFTRRTISPRNEEASAFFEKCHTPTTTRTRWV